MFKLNKKLTVVTSILLLIMLGIGSCLVFSPFQNDKPRQTIIDGYNNNPIFAGNDKYPLIGGYQGLRNIFTARVEFKQTKFDIFKPVYSVIWEYPSNNGLQVANYKQGIDTVYLERKNLTEWKVINYIKSDIIGATFEETLDLAQKHDLTTSFPGKENYKITNYPPLTPEEIENNRKLREQSQKGQEQIKEFENASKEGRLAICLERIEVYKNMLEVRKAGKTEVINAKYGNFTLKDTETIEAITKIINDSLPICDRFR